MRERKEFYKNETVSLPGSLSDNRDALIDANKIIKDLEKEDLDKETILAADLMKWTDEQTSRVGHIALVAKHLSGWSFSL